ncbi:T9SS type A sorting domain-containing protein [Ichthyenterobacterium magnum]|uniref:Putative secreted protein (Por secretion system target) n=1 Tax=Ichthyenterobacterium magnum TaxID=1230530 RepID=A0A420DFG3_9FLAO|nr:T9SS type A sorting domain-containing protein [Ichthyenterobacterium magnum]RKE91960.1 putative secreted protein (Por secretion system target) [Ichthyenterobacterium magnum]
MKKITLLILAITTFQFGFGQNDCANALVVTAGSTTTVGMIDGTADNTCAWGTPGTAGEWYIYTAGVNGIATVSTDLPQNDGITNSDDTRVSIYTGTCAALECHSAGDDVSDTNYLTTLTFAVEAGTSYYILWDDRWLATGFDFTLTETAIDCTTATYPYSYDFGSIDTLIACYTIENTNTDAATWGINNGNDLDGDGSNDSVGLIFPPNPTVAKDDWLFLPVFNGIANADYAITAVYNALNNPVVANESFDIVILDAPSSTAASQNIIGSYSGITAVGTFGDNTGNDPITQAYSDTATYTPTTDGDFYVGIHATTPMATSGILFLFNLSVDETLGLSEFESNTFTHFYNKSTNDLTLNSSNLAFDNVELFNILGQSAMRKSLSQTSEVINLSNLNDGIYLAKVSIAGRTQTIKILKQ